MFNQYKKEVLSAYYKMKADGNISPNLMEATPGKLRDECLIVYHERYSAKDDEVLRLFFNWKDQDYLKGIENYKIDGFKQLAKVLNGKEINLGNRFIELLAWLINYQPRPYRIKNAYAVSNEHISKVIPLNLIPKEGLKMDNEQQIKAPSPQPEQQKKEDTHFKEKKKPIKKIKAQMAILMSALIIIVGILMIYLKNKKLCMYWAGDHYEPISCNEQSSQINVVPYNQLKLNNLKRITKPDTLTLYSARKVWYYKVKKDSIDFYTEPGELPTDNNRRLLPATPYIINKYALKVGAE